MTTGFRVVTMTLDRYQRLTDVYNDLYNEYMDCGDHDERCRCVRRMDEIQKQLKDE